MTWFKIIIEFIDMKLSLKIAYIFDEDVSDLFLFVDICYELKTV